MSTIQSTLSEQRAAADPDMQPRGASESDEAPLVGPAVPASSARPHAEPARFALRTHQPGDMGWIVERHGAVYYQEYGWNREFEALVAGIAGDFLRNLDPARERCWIAESDGKRVGCVLLTSDTQDESAGRLRLLLVERQARGIGLGRALVSECVQFAKAAGYQKLVLWTQESLTAARRLYADAGFIVISRWRHHSFGRDLVAETWELALS